MILEELRRCGEQSNLKYHRDRSSWTIASTKRGPIREEDVTFDDLQKEVKKPIRKARERAAWISETIRRL